MIRKLIKSIFNILSKAETACLVIPKEDKCGAQYAYKILSSHFSNLKLIKRDFQKDSLQVNIEPHEQFMLTKSLIIIGHGSKNGKGLQTYNKAIINPEWITSIKDKFDFLFSYTCYGFDFMSLPSWNNLFKNWATFNGKLYFPFNNPKLERVFSNIFINIGLSLDSLEDTDKFESKILNSLDKSFVKHSKSINDESGDQLLLLVHANIYRKIKFKSDVI